MTGLEGPHKVECGENYELNENDKCDELTLSLLTKLYECIDVTCLEGPQKVDKFDEISLSLLTK